MKFFFLIVTVLFLVALGPLIYAEPVNKPLKTWTNEDLELLDQPVPGFFVSGKDFPPFAFRDQSGEAWTNQDLEGKVVLVAFWSTSCAFCHPEIAELQKTVRAGDLQRRISNSYLQCGSGRDSSQ